MSGAKTALGLLVACAGFAILMQTASAAPFEAYVTEAAARAHIPPAWITAVMHAESQGDATATSPKGAMGLMQIMPDTWRELRHALNLGADPYDPRDNIVAGAAYLRWLHDRYGDAGFLAAYNAGPGRYERFLTTGKTLPDETKKYVSRVIRLLRGESIGSTISDAGFVNQWHAEMPSGNQLFVGPFASQTVVQNAPEVMPVSDHVIRFVAPPHDLFVPPLAKERAVTRDLPHERESLSSHRERFGCASEVGGIEKHKELRGQDKTACHAGRRSAGALRLLVCMAGRSCAGLWVLPCFHMGFSCTVRF